MPVRLKSRSKNIPPIPFLIKFFGTGFFSGFFPFASGTFGSLIAALIFFIPIFSFWYFLLPLIVVFFIVGVYTSEKIEQIVGQDPSIVVIDEFIGMWISLLFLPITFITVFLAFVFFRIFDIFKPFPANYYNDRSGGLAIMMDDVFAGIYANLLVQILVLIINF
jgi:phosphatidylglycerophosphatase A